MNIFMIYLEENGRSLENISMILCGDFHIVAEQGSFTLLSFVFLELCDFELTYKYQFYRSFRNRNLTS